jgi:hypothetical protein
MMYDVEMTSCGMLHLTSFVKIGRGIQAKFLLPKQIWMAVMLVLLKGIIHEVLRRDGLRWYDMHTKFYEDSYRRWRNIKDLPQQVEML